MNCISIIVNLISKDVHVETVNEELNSTMVRDSAIEMELLELFEDITLEEVVANKACAGKVVGCKDMPASVVKKILTGVWRRLGPWRMKKCEEGVLGFFFDNEEDFERGSFPLFIFGFKIGELAETDGCSKSEVVRRGFLRLWIDVWVAHPIPAGFFLKVDGMPESWVQFKYEKLPMLCFNCGRLAHWDKVCHAPMTMVTPRTGEAVPLYGLWIKSDTGNTNCFNSKGKGVLKMEFVPEETPEWDLNAKNRRGFWTRRESWRLTERPLSSEKGVAGGRGPTTSMHQSLARGIDGKEGRSYVGGTSSGRVAIDTSTMSHATAPHVADEGDQEELAAPTNYLNLPNPDFANNHNREDLIPDLGPTLAQCIEVPHEWLCLSQKPHSFPEATPITWPNNDVEAQKLFLQLYEPDYLNLYKAQQSLLSIPPNFSEMINHLLGNSRKRKAHTWLHPIPAISEFSPPSTPSNLVISNNEEAAPKETFCIGVSEEGSCSKYNARGRKTRGRNKSYSVRRSSGVKTRSGRKKCNVVEGQDMVTTGNLEEILNNCIEVAITFERNFGRGEEAAESMPPPSQ
uniref:Zinc knuckle CX2CX4HX4C domain-containing protein n=1 Tax=Cannabis sativa TaxID=3483 RepID=A0A803NHD8_CANSA